MIIVTGHLTVKPGQRQRHLELSAEAVQRARESAQCLDYSVSPDPQNPARVNISERWTDRGSLDAFRGAGPNSELANLIADYAVDEYDVPEPHFPESDE
ncbi:MAG: antibiotic biosynthesis monooxygenase [Antricoccus sp.]